MIKSLSHTSVLNGGASDDRNRHGNRVSDHYADIFKDGYGLFAANDMLDGGILNRLTGDKIAVKIGVGSLSSGNEASGALIEGKDEDITLVSRWGSRKVSFG